MKHVVVGWGVLLAVAPAFGQTFTQLVTFGDSLSDVGNVSNATFGISPGSNYFSGRFSNGPVWVEGLAGSLSLGAPTFSRANGRDYAYGGVKTGPGNTTFVVFSFPNVGTQVNQFLQSNTPSASQLFTVWGGANNFLGNLSQDPAVVVNHLVSHVTALNSAGARYIVVPNLPPLGLTPRYRGTSDESAYNALTAAFNAQLASAMTTLDAQIPAKLYQLDVATAFIDMIANPASFGFTNVTQPALVGSTVVPNPDQYLFYDDVHPTRVGHNLLAAAAFDLVSTHQWVAGSGDFSQASNWDVAGVPAAAWIAAIENPSSNPITVTAGQSSAVRQVRVGGAATLAVAGGAVLSASQRVSVRSGATIALADTSSLNSPTVEIAAGAKLLGGGTVATVRNGGTIAPRSSADPVGTLHVSGDFTQTATGSLAFNLAGLGVGDRVDVGGHASLAGTAALFAPGATPLPGEVYTLLSFASATGSLQIDNQTGYAGLRFSQQLDINELRVLLSGGPGDANLDAVVNIADFALLAANFNQPGNWLAGDFDGSGTVQIADFALLAANFNQPVPSGRPVPEPAGAVLLALVALHRRR